jgi:hypothetical protein
VLSLIAELGDAYCEQLRRTAIGPFLLSDAVEPPPSSRTSVLSEPGDARRAHVPGSAGAQEPGDPGGASLGRVRKAARGELWHDPPLIAPEDALAAAQRYVA